MHRLILVGLMILVGCAPRGIDDGSAYRNTASPIYSNALFDVGRLDGNWDQVAAFAASGESGCRPGGAVFGGSSGKGDINYVLCLSGREVAGAGLISVTGPGRFAVTGKEGLGQDWWVLWVDESYRTMAVGSPSGTFGFILNRGHGLPSDRLDAATEVFDFNGYDTEKLQVFRR